MATERKANVVWQGDLMSGSGTIQSVTSGAFGALDVSWASRSEEPNGKTSPEELIAAAWASCFSMALSAGLAKAGTPPGAARDLGDRHVPARRGDHEGRADRSRHRCRASTPTASTPRPEDAKKNCPVSKALAGIPEVTLDAELAS